MMMVAQSPASAIMAILGGFFRRNNPIEAIIFNIKQNIDFVMNFSSHRKLMRYRSIVYVQQLRKMERNLWAGVAAPEGEKLDRYY
jgi:hypothetical protein